MLTEEIKHKLAVWFRENKTKNHNVYTFLVERICKYSNEKETPSEQIKGMCRLLNDLNRLEDEYLK